MRLEKERKFIDLQLHSYYSDGVDSPRALIQKAKKENFAIVSLTDHHSVDGIMEAIFWGKKLGVKVIPGIEIDTEYKNYSLHLLGYHFDWRDKKLNLVLRQLQNERKEKIKKGIEELENLGFKINQKKIFQSPSVYPGLGLIVDELKKGENWRKIRRDLKLKKGQIVTLPEIFKAYFLKNHQPLIPSSYIDFTEAIRLIKKAGGATVLAHPGKNLSWEDDWLLAELKKKGLDGIEAISAHHNWANIEHYQKLAYELKLIVTAGSDYHGDLPAEWGFPVKNIWQYFKSQISANLSLIARIKN